MSSDNQGAGPEGERRQVTVLFADLVGFTAFSERSGEEAAYKLMQRIAKLLREAVQEHGGTVRSFTGDGVMALFGVPIACDEAAANAVATAIGMQRQMDRVNQDLRAAGLGAITIGIGINTGMVTVGYIGSEERTDYTAIGDSVNLAARLEKQAKANQIIISRSTRDAIGDASRARVGGANTLAREQVGEQRVPAQRVEHHHGHCRRLQDWAGRRRERSGKHAAKK